MIPLYIFFALCSLALSVSAQCYYPGGSWAEDQVPCHKFAFTSLCCKNGWTCYSNNLCVVTDSDAVGDEFSIGTSMRGTCTNPLWNDTACGSFCLNEPVLSNEGQLTACGNNKWCCQPEADEGLCDCDSGEGTFTVADGIAQTIIGITGMEYTSTGFVVPSTTVAVTSASYGASSSYSNTKASSFTTNSADFWTTYVASSSSTRSSSSSISHSGIKSTNEVPSTTSQRLSTSSSFSTDPTSTSSKNTSPTPTVRSTATDNSTSLPSPTGQPHSHTPIPQTVAFKAGIGVTITVLGLALIAGLIYFLRKKSRRNGIAGTTEREGDDQEVSDVSPSRIALAPNPHPYGGESQFSIPRVPVGQPRMNRSRSGVLERLEENPYRAPS